MRAAPLILLAFGVLFSAPRAIEAQRSHRDSSEAHRSELYSRDSIPAYRYRLIGVYDEASGQPLDSVRVTDVLTGLSILTSRTGTATLLFLPDGGSLVRLQRIGYQTKTLMAAIGPAFTTPLTEVMSRVTLLAPVEVRDSAERYISPALRDFEQRKRAGFGYFIDEAEMRKHDNWSMANLLTSRLPGIMPAPSGVHAGQYVVSSRVMCSGLTLAMCRTPNCYPNVYVDGVRYTEFGSLGPNAVDFSKWSPNLFAAAEYYSSLEVPAEFGGQNAKCGVLLLWTRER